MKRLLRFLRSLYAGILFSCLIILLPLVLLGYNLGQLVFDPPRLKQAFFVALTDGDLTPTLMKWWAEQAAIRRGVKSVPAREPEFYGLFKMLELADWRQIRREALPDPLVKDWIAQMMVGFYSWQATMPNDAKVMLTLDYLPAWLAGPPGMKIVDVVYASLEPCNPKQEDQLLIDRIASRPGEFIWCQTSQVNQAYQKTQLERALGKVGASLPAGVELVPLGETQSALGNLPAAAIWQAVRIFRLVASWGWLLPLGMLLLLAPLALIDARSLAVYWGAPILFGGGLGVVLSFFYVTWAEHLLGLALMTSLPGGVLDLVADAAGRVLKTIQLPLQIGSGIVFALGIGFCLPLVAGWVWRRIGSWGKRANVEQ
jgi:hypothetical protein